MDPAVTGLSWHWIAIQMVAPPIAALLLALPFWMKEQAIFGNLAGTGAIFGAAFALIMREHVQLDTAITRCFADGLVCFPDPPAFTRYALYGFIALFEVIVLFSLSIKVENRIRRRGYAPEWR